MNYVIIGNSAAAVGCIEGIRANDSEGKITLLSREAHHTYSRPLISYLLEGRTDTERMKYRPDSFYADNAVDAHLGVSATGIDPAAHTVTADDGACYPYDRLLVATGSSPFVPPMKGIETVEHRFSFMTLDDAEALARAVEPRSRVLIVGAGLIGLKCAEGLHARVGEITVVDLADRILPSILDTDGAAMVQSHLMQHGITFLLGDSVAAFSSNHATLASGRELEFDVLVVAVGVRANTSLVREAGGGVDRGILTDPTGRTDLPDVFAAGDCAQSSGVLTGAPRVIAILPNAYLQGHAAGATMAGGEGAHLSGCAMNAIGFFGLHILTAGTYTGEERICQTDGGYKKFFIEDGFLVGYILIGDVARAGIYTSLIRGRVPLDTIDFDLITEKPQLLAFTRAERERKLAHYPK